MRRLLFPSPMSSPRRRGSSYFRRFWIPAFAGMTLLLASSSQAGDTGLSGFNSRTFRSSSDGSGVYSVTGVSILPHLQWTLGSFTNVATSSLKVVNPANLTTIELVDIYWDQQFSASMGLLDRVMVGMGIPVTLYQTGTHFNTQQKYKTSALGDLWIDGKYRFWKGKGWIPDLALYSTVSFPTGSRSRFTGDENVGWENRLIAEKSFETGDLFVNLGYRLVDSVRVVSTTMDDTLTFGVGGRYILPWQNQSWAVETEFFGKSVLENSSETTTPVEWRLGGRKQLKQFAVYSGFGVGLTSAFGTPRFHGLAGVQYNGPETKKRIKPPVPLATPPVLVHTVHSRLSNCWRFKV